MSRLRARRRIALAIGAACSLALAGCASVTATPPPLVLLGEVHDHAAQPAQQRAVLQDLLARGLRPALLMEQFDRERQADIDRARAAGADAAQLIAAATQGAASRWDWARYRPLVEAALAHDLPIVAANVSRADARKVIADGLAAHGFDARVAEDILAVQAQAIEHSHCGQVDTALARRMALAQVARDQFMARQVQAHAARGVLLIAGHGHVRRDIGVPRWLAAADRERLTVVGLLETGAEGGAFDRVLLSPPQRRDDPCAGMRRSG